MGSYAEERLIVADKLLKIPDGVDDITAAAVVLKGSTAQVLLHKAFKVLLYKTFKALLYKTSPPCIFVTIRA